MSEKPKPSMAPDSHNNTPDATRSVADTGTPAETAIPFNLQATTISTGPLPTGILFKGNNLRKRVSFRDSNLVNIREIPPRSCSGDEDETDNEDEAGSSESDEDTDSDSEEEEEVVTKPPPTPPTPPTATATPKPVTLAVSKASPTPPVSTLNVRPERAPIPWTSMSSFTVAKGSYSVAVSPASKVVSLVSQITGVSSSATQAHIKQRTAAAAASSAPPSKPPSPAPSKKHPPAVVHVDKKVKKITPTMDNVITSQTVRSVQKHGAVSESLHKGNSGKTTKKKRVLQRRQEGGDKRKTTTSRKAKDSKLASKMSDTASKQNTNSKKAVVSSTSGKGRAIANGFSNVRDSLSLPPLSCDDSVLVQPPRLVQHKALPKASVYTMDGFIFPGDPTHDLAAGLKVAGTAQAVEDSKPKSNGLASGPAPGHQIRERISSAPPGSTNRRKRFYAWQMANGNLQSSLHEPPCITPMWETVTPVAPLTAKPAFVADR